MDNLQVFRWLLDVNSLWPNPQEPGEAARATARWATGSDTQAALNLLPPDERTKVLRFYRPSDARLSLASYLLKHRAVVHVCQVEWSLAIIGEGDNKKPCYKRPSVEAKTLEFNVSHHGTLVGLVGCPGDTVRLGVDIVQMNWERDYPKVLRDGFEAWANVYEMVFSAREIGDIAGYVPPAELDSQNEIRAKLRHFYAHWCLKEAYVKMTGEALLAPWLKELEFRNVQVPSPRGKPPKSADADSDWGQICTDVEIWFRSRQITDVNLEIQAFRDDYMIATASSDTRMPLVAFKELDLNLDVVP